MNNFDVLWLGFSKATIATSKELHNFVNKHVNQYGRVVIIVHGKPRYVKWKSVGAGLYRVYTNDEGNK